MQPLQPGPDLDTSNSIVLFCSVKTLEIPNLATELTISQVNLFIIIIKSMAESVVTQSFWNHYNQGLFYRNDYLKLSVLDDAKSRIFLEIKNRSPPNPEIVGIPKSQNEVSD